MSKWWMLAVAATLVLPTGALLADENSGATVAASPGGQVLVIRDGAGNSDSRTAIQGQVQALQAQIQALQHQLAELQSKPECGEADRPSPKGQPAAVRTFSVAQIKSAMEPVKANVSSDTWFPLRKKVAALDGRRITGAEAMELLAPMKEEVGSAGWELLTKIFTGGGVQAAGLPVSARPEDPKAQAHERQEQAERQRGGEREQIERAMQSLRARMGEKAERGEKAEMGECPKCGAKTEHGKTCEKCERVEKGEPGEGLKVIVNGQVKLNPGQPMMMPFGYSKGEMKSRMDVKVHGEDTYGFLGIVPDEVEPVLAAQLGLHDGRGVVIEKVSEGSPAAKAGLRQYDVMTQINDQILYDIVQLKKLVAAQRPGTTVRVELIREGRRMALAATLGGTAVQSWAKEENEEEECGEAEESHEKGEGAGHRGMQFFHRGFGGSSEGHEGQVQPPHPFGPMPFMPMPGAKQDGSFKFHVPMVPGANPGQPGMMGSPQGNPWLNVKPGVAPEKPKPLLHTEAFESGALDIRAVGVQQLKDFLADLITRLQYDRAQHGNVPGPDWDYPGSNAEYLEVWIQQVKDELAHRGMGRPGAAAKTGENGEAPPVKFFVNGQQIEIPDHPGCKELFPEPTRKP